VVNQTSTIEEAAQTHVQLASKEEILRQIQMINHSNQIPNSDK